MSHEPFPYTLIACPCSEVSLNENHPQRSSKDLETSEGDAADQEEKQFDPWHPRSNYSLFPPEHLLYCGDCCELKCPRCVLDETQSYYCPQCLCEVPRKDVRDDGNRCPRNCFDCPLCASRLSLIPTYENKDDTQGAPFFHKCEYCLWTSLECGLKYQNRMDLRRELDKFSKKADRKPVLDELAQGYLRSSLQKKKAEEGDTRPETTQEPIADPLARFHALKKFYKSQLKAESENDDPLGSPFGTPRSHLSRLATIYNIPTLHKKSSNQSPQPMREALHASEGLFLPPSPTATISALSQHSDPYRSTISLHQHHSQYAGNSSGNLTGRFTSQLLPMPSILSAIRSKRCGECKHILVKHEHKPDSARYRIRLVAISYIPLITLKPLSVPSATPTTPTPTPPPTDMQTKLLPNQPHQYLLTLRNHVFERVRVRLGTPALTPGPAPHRVTILCPQFEIGANTEAWDADPAAAAAAVTGPSAELSASTTTREVVAGKVYESGRNWTSVVVEIVPAAIARAVVGAKEAGTGTGTPTGAEKKEVEDADADVVEVPIRVSLEWKVSDEEQLKSRRAVVDADDVGERELNYWMVLGVGRVAE